MSDFGNGNKKLPLIIGISAGVALLAAAGVLLYVFVFSASAKVKKQLAAAEGCMKILDFDGAVAAYQEALKMDPKCEKAYLGLSEAYNSLLDRQIAGASFDKAKSSYQEALSTLTSGTQNTDSAKVKDCLEQLINKHEWKAATCTKPITCILCDSTIGEALGHDWQKATMEKPKTCARCSAKEGDPIICEEFYLDEIIPDKWEGYAFNDETVVGHVYKDDDFVIYDYEGNVVKELKIVEGPYSSWSYSMNLAKTIKYNDVAIITTYFDKENNGKIVLYDQFGEEVQTLTSGLKFAGYLNNETLNERYLALRSNETKGKEIYIDTKTLSIVDKKDMEPVFEYDKTRFSYCVQTKINEDLYYVITADRKHHGFVDKDFNEIAMYKNGTNFNTRGYALVSEDGKNFDIIDSEFNVIAEDYMKADDVLWFGGPVLGVMRGNRKHYYIVK